MKIRQITEDKGEFLLNDLTDGDYFRHTHNIYKKVADGKAEIISSSRLSEVGKIVNHDNFKVTAIDIIDTIASFEIDISKEVLLELELIDCPEDFEEFIRYVESKEKQCFEGDRLIGDYAYNFYNEKKG